VSIDASDDWRIRALQANDLAQLARLYGDTVRQLGAEYYTAEQIAAWSAYPDDAAGFAAWVGGGSTFVAVDAEDACIGFAGLDGDGRIASLYVAPGWVRRGVGSSLLAAVIAEARSRGWQRLSTEASYFSMPLFRKRGFTIVDDEYVEFNGVRFHRFIMQLPLATDPARPAGPHEDRG